MIRTEEYYRKLAEWNSMKPKYTKLIKTLEHLVHLLICILLFNISDYLEFNNKIKNNYLALILTLIIAAIIIFIAKYKDFAQVIVGQAIALIVTFFGAIFLYLIASYFEINNYYTILLDRNSNYKMIAIESIEFTDGTIDDKRTLIYFDRNNNNGRTIKIKNKELYLIKSNELMNDKDKDIIENKLSSKRGRKIEIIGATFNVDSINNSTIDIIQQPDELGSYFIGYDKNKIYEINYRYNYSYFSEYPKFLNFDSIEINENKSSIMDSIIVILETLIKYFPLIIMSQLSFMWIRNSLIKIKKESPDM